jgi:spore germination cell wall hydrolase CwlJ-like protein
MKLMPRAATLAAVTFCVGTIANAATIDTNDLAGKDNSPKVETVNAVEQHIVPLFPQVVTPNAKGEIVQPIPAPAADVAEVPAANLHYASLSDAVAAQAMPEGADAELHCLAVGVYYEAKSESLAGQLAVADVILNRTTSGRFPRSVCGVLGQRGQFSFVRGGSIPTPPANAQWRRAMAVAQVAEKELWDSPVEGALYFHARYVSPSWNRARVGSIGNHIFYR